MLMNGVSEIEVATIDDDGNPAIRGTDQKCDKL